VQHVVLEGIPHMEILQNTEAPVLSSESDLVSLTLKSMCVCIIKFAVLTIFKYTVNWHEIHLHCCATITTIHIQNSLSCKTNTPYPLKIIPLSSAPGKFLYEFDDFKYLI
jgi:hypothetical protein